MLQPAYNNEDFYKVKPTNVRFKFTFLISQFISAAKNGEVLTPEGNIYKHLSLSGYRTLLLHIQEYEGEIGPVMLDHLSPAWAVHFSAFLTRKGLAKNTISTILGKLKSMIRKAHMSGLTPFTGLGIRTPKESTTTIYNSLSELKKMYEHDFSGQPARERVRDLYIFNCFTGMRIADLLEFSGNPSRFIREIDGIKFIDYTSHKTKTQSVIPLSTVSTEILERRNYDFGIQRSYQVFNRIIKKVAEFSGIKENVTLVRTVGGKRKEYIYPKHQLMSSHTARRTFATLAELNDVPRNSIMQMTGHTSEDSYLRYIRNSSSQNAIRIKDHEFFKIIL